MFITDMSFIFHYIYYGRPWFIWNYQHTYHYRFWLSLFTTSVTNLLHTFLLIHPSILIYWLVRTSVAINLFLEPSFALQNLIESIDNICDKTSSYLLLDPSIHPDILTCTDVRLDQSVFGTFIWVYIISVSVAVFATYLYHIDHNYTDVRCVMIDYVMYYHILTISDVRFV